MWGRREGTEEEQGKEERNKFPLCLSGLRTPHRVREDTGLIPVLVPWLKDAALP